MTDHRVARGRASQEYVAAALRDLGLIYARSRPASLPGSDVENAPGLYIEVKATEAPRPGVWVRDNARKAAATRRQYPGDPGPLPLVVFRPRGYGQDRLDDWPVMLRWADLVPVLRDAGHLPDPMDGGDR